MTRYRCRTPISVYCDVMPISAYTRYRISRYRVSRYQVLPDIGFPDIGIFWYCIRYRFSRYRVFPDIGYTRYRVNADIGCTRYRVSLKLAPISGSISEYTDIGANTPISAFGKNPDVIWNL
jgi:hypothetical protein